ncbi:MAG: ADP-ribosylglycohydrolase family protein, partial [Synergistaceae bacterium]|nr:ADP-ribosylglycohydrolase family protein [Synergistaceae bacterium]
MLGAIVGDIVGSPYEFDRNNIKTTEFPLFSKRSQFTDDTVMTLAVAEAIMLCGETITETEFEKNVIKTMQDFGLRYPYAGYGGRFAGWLTANNPKPYDSFGNGSAMRVSPVAWAFDEFEDVERFAAVSARVSHNHPEGIKGAQATATAILLARQGKSQPEIKRYIEGLYGYDLNRTLDEIRPTYYHVESCQKTVPEAITAFLEADGFEDAVRKAVSLGGDSDTLTAITASIAEAAWGIPKEIEAEALSRLDPFLRDVLERWEAWRGKRNAPLMKRTEYDDRQILLGLLEYLTPEQQAKFPSDVRRGDRWFSDEEKELCYKFFNAYFGWMQEKAESLNQS